MWNLEGVLDAAKTETPLKLTTKAVVAAHEKDINSMAVAPNDSLLCTGSQVVPYSYVVAYGAAEVLSMCVCLVKSNVASRMRS